MNLAEFRQQYPQYNDMSDQELADGLYQKFYSDMPREEFNASIGFQTVAPLGMTDLETYTKVPGDIYEGTKLLWEQQKAGEAARLAREDRPRGWQAIAQSVGVPTPEAISTAMGGMEDILGVTREEQLARADATQASRQEQLGKVRERLEDPMTETAKIFRQGATSVGPSLIGMVAGVGLKSPSIAATSAGAFLGKGVYDDTYLNTIEKTGDHELATRVALVDMLAEAIPEAIGLDKIMKLGGPYLFKILKAAGVEGTEEVISQIMQRGNHVVQLNEKVTWGEFAQELKESFLGGAMWGGIMKGAMPFEGGKPVTTEDPFAKLKEQFPELQYKTPDQIVAWLEQQDSKAQGEFLEKAQQGELFPDDHDEHVRARENIPTPIDPNQRDMFEQPSPAAALERSERPADVTPVTRPQFYKVVSEWRDQQREQTQLELVPKEQEEGIPFKSANDSFQEYLMNQSPSILGVVINSSKLQGMLKEITSVLDRMKQISRYYGQREAQSLIIKSEKGGKVSELVKEPGALLPGEPYTAKTTGARITGKVTDEKLLGETLDELEYGLDLYGDMLGLMMSEFRKAMEAERLSVYDMSIIAKALDLPESSIEKVLKEGDVKSLRIEKTKTADERRWDNPWFPSELKVDKVKSPKDYVEEEKAVKRLQDKMGRRISQPSNVDARLVKMMQNGAELGDLLDVIHRQSDLPKLYRAMAFLINSNLSLLPAITFNPKYLETDPAAGQAGYFRKAHRIEVWKSDEVAITILHESIHAVTARLALRMQELNSVVYDPSRLSEKDRAQLKIYRELERIRLSLAAAHEKVPYELTTMDEFLAGITTEKAFQDWLKGIKLSELGLPNEGSIRRFRNAGDYIWKQIKKWLGWDKALDDNLFVQTMELATAFVNSSKYIDQAWTPGTEEVTLGQQSKDDVDRLRQSLPKNMQHLAPRLAEAMKEIAKNETGAEELDNLTKHNPKMKEVVKSFLPDLRSYDEVEGTFDDLKDISGGLREKMGQQVAGGGKMYAWVKQHPAIKWAVDKIDAARRRTEVQVNDALFSDKGVLTAWQKLDGKKQGELWQVILDNHRMKDLTNEDLAARGMNQDQIDAYNITQYQFNKVLETINARRVASGMKPVKRVKGYWPSRWDGAYYITIRSPQGRLLSVETSDRAKDLEALSEKLANEGYEVSEPMRRSSKKEYKDHLDMFSKVADTMLAVDTEETKRLQAAVFRYSQELANQRLAFPRHAKPAGGIGGFKGFRANQTDTAAAAKDALDGLRGYFRDAYDWTETKSMMTDINKFLNEQGDKATRLKNVKRYTRMYLNNSLDIETGLSKTINEFAGKLPEAMGYSPDAPKKLVHGLKSFGLIYLLAFWRPSFLMAQAIQPTQFMPSMLQAAGANVEMVPLTMARGYSAAIKALSGDSLTGWEQRAWEYAISNRVVVPHFLEDVYDAMSVKTHKVRKALTGEMAIEVAEKFGRTVAFMQGVSHLVAEGIELEAALPMASEMTDMAMTNYRRHERPLLYRNFGVIGDAASALTTFRHNYFTQLYKYAKEIVKNPKEIRNHTAFLSHVQMQFMIAGLLGLPFVADADWLVNMLRQNFSFAHSWKTPSEGVMEMSATLPQWGKDTVRYGALSGITGWDLSPSLAAAPALPQDGLSQVFIVPGVGIEMIKNTAPAIGALLEGSLPNKAETAQAATQLPGAFRPFVERYFQDPHTGIIPNARRNMEGGVVRPTDLGSEEWMARFAGARTTKEAEEQRADWMSREQDMAFQAEKGRLLQSAIKKAVSGQEFQDEITQYVQMGGDPQSFVTAIETALVNTQLSSEQRRDLQGGQSITGMQRWMRYKALTEGLEGGQ